MGRVCPYCKGQCLLSNYEDCPVCRGYGYVAGYENKEEDDEEEEA